MIPPAEIQPVILAGGLGTRLRPRTAVLPKPMLPIDGRPILWYTLRALRGSGLRHPIVALDYKGEVIEAFFSKAEITFQYHRQLSMAEAFLRSVEQSEARAFLGLSADVLLHPSAISRIMRSFAASGGQDTLLVAQLPQPGHKKWEYVIHNERLQEIQVRDVQTRYERLLLVLTKGSLSKIRSVLGPDLTELRLPTALAPYQTGWTLILKTLLFLGIPVAARVVDLPVCNINVPADFVRAEQFVQQHWQDVASGGNSA